MCFGDSGVILQVKINMLKAYLTPLAAKPHSVPSPAFNVADMHKSTAGQSSDKTDCSLKCGLRLQLKVKVPGTPKALSFPSAHTETKTFLCACFSLIYVGDK